MTENEALGLMNRLADGQSIRVTVASGRVFDGVYNGEETSLETGLYFDTLDGKTLRAEWEKVTDVSFTSSRLLMADKFVVPPEHPLSPQQPGLLRPYTVRNPVYGAEE